MQQWNQLKSWLSQHPTVAHDTAVMQFVEKHDFLPNVNTKDLSDEYSRQAQLGLHHKNLNTASENTSLLMANSRICADSSAKMTDLLPAVVIDAGGTNLRIVGIENKDGKVFFSFYEKKKIPGSRETITAKDFFYQLSLLICPILQKAPFNTLREIKFCFSYPFYIDENGEARVISLTKEITIENIKDMSIDEMLKKNINAQLGEERIQNIVTLNDAVATLLASYTEMPAKISADVKENRLGLVLGTGLNMAYQEWWGENGAHIGNKNKNVDQHSIINTELGSYDQLCHTIVDKKIDQISSAPGKGLLEKGVSGAYLGQWVSECLSLAAKEGLLSQSLTTQPQQPWKVEEISRWLAGETTQTLAGHLIDPQSDDGKRIKMLLHMAIFRSASLAAFASYATIRWATRKSEKVTNKIILSLNGSVITKTHGYLEIYKKNLQSLLSPLGGEKKIEISFVDVEHSPTMGSIYAKKMH